MQYYFLLQMARLVSYIWCIISKFSVAFVVVIHMDVFTHSHYLLHSLAEAWDFCVDHTRLSEK
jgi:hypothetical protein